MVSSDKTQEIAERQQRIREAIQMRAGSIRVIHELTGIPISRISPDIRELGYKSAKDLRFKQLEKHLKSGSSDLKGICLDLDMKTRTILKYVNDHDLEAKLGFSYDDFDSYPYDSRIDELLEQGLTASQIGKRLNQERENMRFYIKASAQKAKHEELVEKHNSPRLTERQKTVRQTIVSTLAAKLEHTPKTPAEKYATKFLLTRSRGRSSLTIEQVQKTFEAYFSGNSSLEEIRKLGGLNFPPQAQQMLAKVGLTPHYPRMDYLKPEDKQTLEELYSQTNFTMSDVDAIAGWSRTPTMQRIFKQHPTPKQKFVGYTLAMQIYQLSDKGNTPKQIQERLQIDDLKFVNGALKRREEYTPDIIRGLQILFDDNSIDKPYL